MQKSRRCSHVSYLVKVFSKNKVKISLAKTLSKHIAKVWNMKLCSDGSRGKGQDWAEGQNRWAGKAKYKMYMYWLQLTWAILLKLLNNTTVAFPQPRCLEVKANFYGIIIILLMSHNTNTIWRVIKVPITLWVFVRKSLFLWAEWNIVICLVFIPKISLKNCSHDFDLRYQNFVYLETLKLQACCAVSYLYAALWTVHKQVHVDTR